MTVWLAVLIHLTLIALGIFLCNIGIDLGLNKENDTQVRIWGWLCFVANSIVVLVNALFLFAALML